MTASSRRGALVLATLLGVAATDGNARTIHVTADASRTGSGQSWDDPTVFQRACRDVAAGDTVLVRAGDYGRWPQYSSCAITASGAADAPITLRSEGGPVTVRRSTGWARISGSWVVVDGIGCRDADGACVSVVDAAHVVIRRLEARRVWRAVDVRGTSDSRFEDLVVEDAREGVYLRRDSRRNVIRNSEFRRIGVDGTAGDRCAICIGERGAGRGNRVEGNLIEDSGSPGSDYAITVYDAPESAVTGNRIRRSRSGGIMVTQYSTDSLIADNTVEDSGSCLPGWSNIAGISVRNASSGTRVTGNRISRQTVCPGNPWGDKGPRGALDVRGWNDPGRPLDNLVLTGNVITGTVGGPDVHVDPRSLVRDMVLR